jgi:hypothetical protein
VLLAIRDQAFIDGQPPFSQRVAGFYRRLGLVIRPDSMFLMGWYVLISIIFTYYVLEIGLLIAFGSVFWQDEMEYVWWLQVLWLGILLLDMMISPIKAYYSEGLLIKDVSLILNHYLKAELYFDIVGILVIALPMAIGNVNANWVKLLWLVKLYSMDKINDEFQRITQLYIIPNTIYLVFKLVLLSLIYAHFMAIFFYLLSLHLYNTNHYGPNTPNIVWVYNSWAFTQMAFLSWYNMYAYIMYYGVAVITTIAYGDVTPKNPI